MGFIKAFAGALGGSLADQWKDYLTTPPNLSNTAGLCPAVRIGSNADRGSNTDASHNIITNGSLIVVPEGFALITLENGAITGYIDECGGYQWTSDDINSESFLSGSGARSSLLKQSWDRFKFGGMPGSFQRAVFVSLKEIANLKFGTQSEIYWDDAYLNTQAGAIARGTYTIRIIDPITFLKQYVPAKYYMDTGSIFDFNDFDNAAAHQLFMEVVGSLAGAFSAYANDPGNNNRIMNIQRDSIGFALSLGNVLRKSYHWEEPRGISLVTAALVAIDYVEETKELIRRVQQADALMGMRGNSNLQASFAAGIQAAGSNPDGGALGMGFMGMGLQGVAGTATSLQQPVPQSPASSPTAEDPLEKLKRIKSLLDEGIITREDFEAAKKAALNI